MSGKLKVIWVVTVPLAVKTHLIHTLKRAHNDFDVCVVGQDMSQFRESHPEIRWVDVNIERKISLFADISALFSLCRLFLSVKPDIVQSVMPKAGLLAAVAGYICRVPVRIHTFTGQVWATKNGLARAAFHSADRLINTLNSVCLTDSHSQSVFLHENKISHNGEPLPTILHGSLSGVDIERFNRSSSSQDAEHLRQELGLSDEHFVFSFIARKTRDKGAIDMLRAFSEVSESFDNARLVFVGPDEDGEILQLRKTEPGLFVDVIDVGYVSNHEVYLAISDVLCLPSYREGFGTIVIDAAAMGVTTIGSRIPGLVDSVVEGETGVLFPLGDLDELVNLMIYQMKNPERRKAMGVCAKARVDEFFATDQHYAALKEFYVQCVKDDHGANGKPARLS